MRKAVVVLAAVISALAASAAAAKTVEEMLKEKGVITEADYKEVTGRTGKATGMYAETGYLVVPKHLELAARYTWYDPNEYVSNNLVAQVQGAVSWYIHDHNLKLQGDYTNIHTQNGTRPTTDDQQVRIQAQVTF
jgi:hypothetical protein